MKTQHTYLTALSSTVVALAFLFTGSIVHAGTLTSELRFDSPQIETSQVINIGVVNEQDINWALISLQEETM